MKKTCVILILFFSSVFMTISGKAANIRDNILLQMSFEGNLDDSSLYGVESDFLNGSKPPEYVKDLADSKSLRFNGMSDSWVEIPDAEYLNIGIDDFPISLWTKKSEEEWITHFIEKFSYTENDIRYGYMLGCVYNVPQLVLHDTNGNSGFFIPVYKFDDNGGAKGDKLGGAGWHHLVITVDRDKDDGVVFYIGGEKIQYTLLDPKNTKIASINSSITNYSPFRLGTRSGQPANNFEGDMDELTPFNRVLTSDEVMNSYYLPLS